MRAFSKASLVRQARFRLCDETRKRCALPRHVLFPIAPPPEGSKAYPAYQEICDDLMSADVEVVLAHDEASVVAFAGTIDLARIFHGSPSRRLVCHVDA